MPTVASKNSGPPERDRNGPRRSAGEDRGAAELTGGEGLQNELSPLDSPLAKIDLSRRRRAGYTVVDSNGAVHVTGGTIEDPVANARVLREGFGVPPEKAKTGGSELASNPKGERADSVPD